MNNKFYIYLHIKETTGEPFYIGKGCGNRLSSTKNRNKYWLNIVDKHGYDVVLLEEGLSEPESFERETYWINRIGRKDLGNGPLVNMTDGGEGVSGYQHSEETKERLRVSSTGYIHTPESKQKITESNRVRVISDTTKLKVTGENNPMFGKHHTDETKLKMTIKKIGDKNIMYGNHHTDEAKLKMSECQSGGNNNKAIMVLDCLNGIYYETIKEASGLVDYSYSKFKIDIKNNKIPNLKII